jgi:hypothetical protein
MNVNLGTTERIIRAIIGLILLSLVVIGPHSWWGLIGLIPLATAIVSFCPVWQVLGINTCGK